MTAATDRPFLVKRDAFLRIVDQDDFACRESAIVVDAYLDAWFHCVNGGLYFNLPAVYVQNDSARFINGRHRAALLLRHLELVPMAVVARPAPSNDLLTQISHRALDVDDVIELPDLPIMNLDNLTSSRGNEIRASRHPRTLS